MITEKKSFFLSKNIFLSKSRHVSNLAPTYFFEENILKEIKRVGLTLEMMEEMAAHVHIYVYLTQITIHGIITEEQIKMLERVQGYKSCYRNENGTLGVNYSAVDIEKKEKLNNILKHIRELFKISVPELHHTSNGTIFEFGFKEKELREEMYEKVDLSLFHGRKSNFTSISKNKTRGTYCFEIEIGLMKEDMIWPIINNWTGITFEKYQEAIALKEKEREVYREKEKEERAQLLQQLEQREKKLQDNYEASLKELAHLPLWDGKVDKDMIIVSSTRTDADLRFQFVWLHKNPWDWRYECHASHDNKESLPGGGLGHFFHFHSQGARDHFLANHQWHVWEEKAKPIPKVEVPQQKIQDLELRPYKNALALFGNTSPHEELLKKIGGKKNDFLTHPVTGIITTGWIFFTNKRWDIERAFKIKITPPALAISA